jgi:hypothetical protein
MLDSTGTLLSLAEIAAAFAGFAALVSVLRRGAGQPTRAVHDILRLRLVISSSVAGVAAALIPVGLAVYGLDAALTWKLAAGVFLVLGNGIIASFVGAYRPVRGTFRPDHLAVAVVTTLELIEQASLAAVIVGFSQAPLPALYMTALIANLCQAAFIFVRFVESTFRHESDVLPD